MYTSRDDDRRAFVTGLLAWAAMLVLSWALVGGLVLVLAAVVRAVTS